VPAPFLYSGPPPFLFILVQVSCGFFSLSLFFPYLSKDKTSGRFWLTLASFFFCPSYMFPPLPCSREEDQTDRENIPFAPLLRAFLFLQSSECFFFQAFHPPPDACSPRQSLCVAFWFQNPVAAWRTKFGANCFFFIFDPMCLATCRRFF